MHDDDSRALDEQYGNWPWIVGILAALVVFGLMFGLATGFA